MLDHLVALEEGGFVSEGELTPAAQLDGMARTADWLEQAGFNDDEVIDEAQKRAAQDAFAALTVPLDAEATKAALTKVEVPKAVRHLVGMLTAYEWTFVEQASQLRGYCIAQLLEETKHPDAKVRLKAVELLGKVTEVALFTERVEHTTKNITEEELEVRLKDKMDHYMKLLKVVEPEASSDSSDASPQDAG